MTALSKFLVLLALFLLENHAHAFTSLSSVARHQVRVNHLIRLQQPMSNPTNEPSSEPICKSTNDQMNDPNHYKEEPLQKHCCTDLGI
jgi:hypothetical protein